MKKTLSILFLFLSCVVNAQIVASDAFLQGNYVEVGMSSCGSFGTNSNSPAGYHSRVSTGSVGNQRLGFVADHEKNGWTVGTTNFVGDYFLPGTPEEGWGLTINGTSYNNNRICAENGIPGSITNYNSSASQTEATWQGNIGGLNVTAKTFVPKNSLYFVTEVTVTNTSASTINNVFYMRNVDPDQGVYTPGSSGGYSTTNQIVSQNPNTCNDALVSAISSGGFYLGLGSIDPRARVTHGGFGNRSALDIWNGTGLNSSGTATADQAISISFNLGNLVPNQVATFRYTYILNAADLTDALAATNTQFSSTGVNYSSGSNINTCPSGTPITLTNTGTFTSWSWSPATGLNTTTGTSVISTVSAPTTYTVVGTGPCGTTSLQITVNPVAALTVGNAGAITGPNSLILGQTGVNYSIAPVANATRYSWVLPPGAIVTSGLNSNSITFNTSNISWCGNIVVTPQNDCGFGGSSAKAVCAGNQLLTSSIASTLCGGQPLSVSYTAAGIYNSSNVFSIQLSDAFGDFTASTTIGSISSNALSGTIATVIPANTPSGTGYRIRVVASLPFLNGLDNGTNLSINILSATVVVTAPTCASAATNILSTYSASLTYTSTPIGLSVGAGGVITGGTTGTSYTITSTNASLCSATSSSFTFDGGAILPIPEAFSVTGGGSYCSGTGLAVGLANSTTGINYQLQFNGVNDGTAVAGTGSAISFGTKTATGTYTVIATNTTTNCTAAMTGSAVITICLVGSIGDTVWYDANGDGILDAGENRLAGATVTLDPGTPSNTADDITTTTNATGNYLFNNLLAGTYTVSIEVATITSGIPAGYNSAQLVPTFDADSNVGTPLKSTIVLGHGQNNLDQDFAFVKPSDSTTGGFGGGVESESLGDAISKIYVGRKMNSVPTEFVKSSKNIYNKSVLKTAQGYAGKAQTMVDMFPKELVAGNIANETSPKDILNYTIADQVLSVDFSLGGKTKAVVLGIKTTNKVYNHTKASCDRLRGAEILNIQKIKLQGYNFLMQGIKQRNGVVEYAVSFAVAKNTNDTSYSIQTNWYVNAYTKFNDVYNFQVWSTKPSDTQKLVSDILNNLKAYLPVNQIGANQIPETYASKVYREKGELIVKLRSTNVGNTAEISMEELYSETANNIKFRNNTLTTAIKQELRVNIADGYEYDGLVKINSQVEDAFYHADGNWGMDFDKKYTKINNYFVWNNFNRKYLDDEYSIDRNFEIKATTDDYLTVYKSLLPGTLSADYSEYNYVAFTAKGSGLTELGLVKSSIEDWKSQYRIMVDLTAKEQTYYIPFDAFISASSKASMTPDDLTTLTFTFLPLQAKTKQLDMMISNVKFVKVAGNDGIVIKKQVKFDNSLLAYPNPSNGKVNLMLFSNNDTNATITLSDLLGRTVYKSSTDLKVGRNELDFNLNVTPGTYIVKVSSKDTEYGASKIIFR